MHVTFRADASSTIGYGHLSRCLTLAAGLRARGAEVLFAMREPSAHTRAWVERAGHRLVTIAGDEIGAFTRVAERSALVVVDGYGFDATWHEALRGPQRAVCVIDDLADKPVRGDVVVNGNLFAENLAYDLRPGALSLLGPSFALVREEFARARVARSIRNAHDGLPRLLVTMGGADPARATELAIEACRRLPPCSIRVVVGAANPRIAAIEAALTDLRHHEIEMLVEVQDMSKPMLWCDLALTAAGSTCLELSCVGVAGVTVVVADNQVPVARELDTRGLMRAAGRAGELDVDALTVALTALLHDPESRDAMERRQRATVDGEGVARVAELLTTSVRRATHPE